MERCDVLFISIRRFCSTRLDELFQSIQFPSLGGDEDIDLREKGETAVQLIAQYSPHTLSEITSGSQTVCNACEKDMFVAETSSLLMDVVGALLDDFMMFVASAMEEANGNDDAVKSRNV